MREIYRERGRERKGECFCVFDVCFCVLMHYWLAEERN